MVWHDIVSAIMLGDFYQYFLGYLVGGLFSILAFVSLLSPKVSIKTKVFLVILIILVSLLGLYGMHLLTENMQLWYVTPLAPHLELK